MSTLPLRHASLSLLSVLAAASGCATDADRVDDIDITSTTVSALSANEQAAFNFFVAKGLTELESSGVVGNLMQESSMNPSAVEFGGGPGRGIAQWSVGGRWDNSTNRINFASQALSTFGAGQRDACKHHLVFHDR